MMVIKKCVKNNFPIIFFQVKKGREHRSERNEITSSQPPDTGELIKINTAYCDKFLGNTPRNLIWNIIDYMLFNVVRRAYRYAFRPCSRVSSGDMHKKKKMKLQYTAKIILVFQSRMNSKTAQRNTVKVPAAQFRIAYCPSQNV